MTASKIIAASAFHGCAGARFSTKSTPRPPYLQRGVSLVELMVGIAIGLLVIAVATSALMVSRGVSGTVSDASEIQQQAAYALRVIGGQLRQAGSLRVNLNSTNAVANNELLAPVAFEKKADGSSDTAYDFNLDQPTTLFNGTDSTLTVGFQRYADPVFSDADAQTIARNCLGGPGGLASDATGPGSFKLVQSVFRLDTTDNELECTGNGNVQPIIKNVANFQVRYLRQVTQAPDTLAGNPLVQYMDAASITNWGQVQGVEVCLVIYGNEPIDLPSGSTYRDCSGAAVDMTTLTGARAKRMHLVFRNVFQLRSQGLV